MQQHQKKMIAPIVVSVIIIVYYAFYFCFLFTLLEGIWKYALGLIPLAFSAVMIKVCVEPSWDQRNQKG